LKTPATTSEPSPRHAAARTCALPWGAANVQDRSPGASSPAHEASSVKTAATVRPGA
jgi:hypothetical protein